MEASFGWVADTFQNHRASYGFAPHRRHAVRVCCQAERPYFDGNGKSQEEEYISKGIWGRLPVNKDGSGVVNYND
jgi:sulfonate dioxygenase